VLANEQTGTGVTTSGALSGTFLDCTAGGRFGIDDAGLISRVAFRTGDETGMTGGTDVKHATTGDDGFKGFGDKTPSWSAGTATSSYNSTSGILTMEKRGGYATSDAATISLKGPGTLYTTHLDLNAEGDYVSVSSTGDDWTDVKLTGNYSACIRMASLEAVYTDTNLASGSAEGGSTARTSTHDTEETQNHAAPQGTADPNNRLCHDVLTGKVLGPAPVQLDNDATVEFVAGAESTYSTGNFADGFTLQYVYDDWYVQDTTTPPTGCSLTLAGGSATGPQTAPTNAWFVDEDLNRRSISGKMHAEGGGGTGYKVILEKVQAPGTWGFLLDDNAVVFGPKDTWGHEGSALPYYASGGSTGTDAPSNLIDQGEGDSTGGTKPDPTTNDGSGAPASAGGPLDHAGTGGLVNTAGGGPVGARAFNKHGDVIPGSARGNHPDYWAEEVVEVDSWGPSASPVTVSTVKLQKSQGSPPSPMYRFQVVTCNADGCDNKKRAAYSLQTVDIGQYEPKATFFGDLDPKTRVLAGEITVVAPSFAMGLQGYRFYPTADGDTNLALRWSDTATDEGTGASPTDNAHFTLELLKSCPPDSRNEGWTDGNSRWQALAQAPCGNDNPYSPKCRGKSCAHVSILPGSQGEFYISRFDNNGNAENADGQDVDEGQNNGSETNANGNLPQGYSTNTARRNYGDNEAADIYMPRDGWLTPILMDVPDDDDTLLLKTSSSDDSATAADCELSSDCTNVKGLTLSEYHDITTSESVIEWRTDLHETGHGFTLIFQPNYPELELSTGTPMAQGASGYRVVSVYGSADAAAYDVDDSTDSQTARTYNTEYRPQDTVSDAYVETRDWLVPNVTCTPTTMHCPLPSTWAHINYTTPSLYPEPAEGSCLQQKSGVSSLSGCSDKTNLNTRWYSANSPTTSQPGNSLQNTDEEDNGQAVAADSHGAKHANWAGNCGDASSYFWFEKIACGSTRTFHTDRSLIEDFVQLTPTWEDIQQILDLYYTTKAPLAGDGAAGPGFTFINADYHVPPVLPPKVNCSCMASMDAYASLLSVVSKTPTPGAPVTLDPEVLNTGTSKMIATLRMYQDPTYSIPASSTAAMPVVVSRFYLEVSTKFTRNRITISDCTSAHKENSLNATDALKPRLNYCDNSTFDTLPERSPAGVTHMDRLSMKKFKYQGTTDVFMQCKIRACAQQPCGVCTGTGDPRRALSTDLSPVEGEMFAPPVSVRVSASDKNALVFGQPVGPVPTTYEPATVQSLSSANAVVDVALASGVSQPFRVRSEMSLPVTAAWATQNQAALVATLRSTLALLPEEQLVILSIKAGRRLEETRSLQAGNAKIDFTVGVASAARASVSQRQITQLSSGSAQATQQFVSQLDTELQARGAAPVNLSPAALSFTPPTRTTSNAATATQQSAQLYNAFPTTTSQDGESAAPAKNEGSSTMVVLFGAMAAVAVALFAYQRGVNSAMQKNNGAQMEGDAYASKTAHLDGEWQEDQAQAWQ
jgi:hypothetical protein